MAFQLDKENAVIAGVCSGLAKDCNIDPFIIRLLFVIFFLAGGSGILLYLVLWFLMALNK